MRLPQLKQVRKKSLYLVSYHAEAYEIGTISSGKRQEFKSI